MAFVDIVLLKKSDICNGVLIYLRHKSKLLIRIAVAPPYMATLTRGAPVSVISTGLGHTSEEMTRIYLGEFDVSQLDKVNSMVTNLVWRSDFYNIIH